MGTWRDSICENVAGQYSNSELKIGQSSFTFTEHIYSDSNCITMVGMGETGSFTYKTGNTVTTSNGNKATELDLTRSAAEGGETLLDIYAITDNKLYFGDTEVLGTIRPTALDFTSYFVKI